MYQKYTTPSDQSIVFVPLTVAPDHEVRLISHFVDQIPDEFILEEVAKTGRPRYHPRLLFKLLLFAYSRAVTSGRQIQRLCEESIPARWLTNNTVPSYKTINNFRSNPKTGQLIKYAFICFANYLNSQGMIQDRALFIDGTKLQADAYIHSFVWRKATLRYNESLNQKLLVQYEKLQEAQISIQLTEEQIQSSLGVQSMIYVLTQEIERLNQAIEAETVVPVGGSALKRRRRTLKKYKNRCVKDYLPRKLKYEVSLTIFQGRNSYSKTDPDATFMCMKEDPMRNRELKPGYNLQIATNGQYVIDFQIFPNPTDTRTLIPFLGQIETLDFFDYIVADAGYGSEQNYEAIDEVFDKTALIPYGRYRKEQTKKFKQDPTQRQNWAYDELTDTYWDHDGVQFSFAYYSTRTDKYGYQRDFKVYLADKTQRTEALDQLARTPKGYQRRMSVNYNWEFFKYQAVEALESKEGQRLYAQRKVDVETVFGCLKEYFGMRRVHVRGKTAVYNDIGLALLSHNLTKLAIALRERASFFFFIIPFKRDDGWMFIPVIVSLYSFFQCNV